MKIWKIKINRVKVFTINATDEATARAIIMKIENCPARSILSIKEV